MVMMAVISAVAGSVFVCIMLLIFAAFRLVIPQCSCSLSPIQFTVFQSINQGLVRVGYLVPYRICHGLFESRTQNPAGVLIPDFREFRVWYYCLYRFVATISPHLHPFTTLLIAWDVGCTLQVVGIDSMVLYGMANVVQSAGVSYCIM